MYKFLTKNGQVLSFAVGAIISIIFILMAVNGTPDGFDELPKEEQFTNNSFNFGLMGAVALVIIAFALAIVFGVIQTATNPKGALKGIIGVVALVVVFFLAYSMGDDTVKEIWASDFDVTPGVSKYVSGALTTTFVLLGIAVLAFIVSEVRNFFK